MSTTPIPLPQQTPIVDFKTLMSDPDFNKLDDEHQLSALTRAGHTDFGQITPEAYRVWRKKNGYGYQQQVEPQPSTLDKAIEFVKPAITNTMAAMAGLGATAANAELGPLAPVAGAAAYTGTNLGMNKLIENAESVPPQGIVSKGLGLTPGSFASSGTNAVENDLVGRGLEGLVGKGIKYAKNLKDALTPVATAPGDVLRSIGKTNITPFMDDAAGYIRNVPGAVKLDRGKYEAEMIADAFKNNKFSVANGKMSTAEMDKLASGNNLASKILNSYRDGEPISVDELMKLRGEAVANGNTKLSDGLTQDIRSGIAGWKNGSKDALAAFNKSIGIKPELESMVDSSVPESKTFFQNVSDQFGKNALSHYSTVAGLSLPIGLLTGHTGGAFELASAGLAGVKLTKAMTNTLLTNPSTRRIMLQLSKNEPLGVSEKYASKVISQVLNGSKVALFDASGNSKNATLRDGKLVPD